MAGAVQWPSCVCLFSAGPELPVLLPRHPTSISGQQSHAPGLPVLVTGAALQATGRTYPSTSPAPQPGLGPFVTCADLRAPRVSLCFCRPLPSSLKRLPLRLGLLQRLLHEALLIPSPNCFSPIGICNVSCVARIQFCLMCLVWVLVCLVYKKQYIIKKN